MNDKSPKVIARRLFEECWQAGKVELLQEIMASDHIFHLAGMDVVGREPYKGLVAGYIEAFAPNYSIKRVISEDEFAALHYTESGIFKGAWQFGEQVHEPTGKAYLTFGVEMMRVVDGQVTESWPGHDSFAHFSQIGVAKT